MYRRLGVIAAALMLSGTAQAHVGVGDGHGFEHGFWHPISGIDHILAMIGVGLFAAHLGGRALWLVPLSFVSMMIVGGGIGMSGAALPFVELGIGTSVVVLGMTVATRLEITTTLAMALVGFFAIFHGHAHGSEMPETVSGLEYGAGFVVATAALHAAGVSLGFLMGKTSEIYCRHILQTAGSAMAIAGIAILVGRL
jgi:urease accessory protein